MKLLATAFYKLKMMVNDRLFFVSMVLIPLLITIATGYALRYEKLNIIPVAFVDEDNTEYSKTLFERLSAKEGLRIMAADRQRALEMLKDGEIEGLFVIARGFQERISQGDSEGIIEMVKSPSSFAMDFVQEVIAGEVMRFIAGHFAVGRIADRYKELGKETGATLEEEIIRHVDSQWENGPLMSVEYRELEAGKAKEAARVSMPAATATSAGIITVFIMFYILFNSGWLIEERINGTLERLISGPGALGWSFSGNVLALFIAGVVQITLFSAIDRLAFGVELFPGAFSYIVFMSYLLAVISISMFLSALLKTPAQLQAGAPVFALFTGFVGGCFWNFVDMPERLKRLALLTPQGWALKGINSLLINPRDAAAAILPVAVLILISLILLPLSYIIINRQIFK